MQSITLSRDGRWLAVHCNVGWSRADVHLIDRETGTHATLIEGVEAQTVVRVVDDRLIGVTNFDAPLAAGSSPCLSTRRRAMRGRRLWPRPTSSSTPAGSRSRAIASWCTVRNQHWRWCARTPSTAPTCVRWSCRSRLARGLRRGRGTDAGVPPTRVVRASCDAAPLDAHGRRREVGHFLIPGRRRPVPCRADQVPVDRRRRRADVPRPPG